MNPAAYYIKPTGRPGAWAIYNSHDRLVGAVTRDPDTYIWAATIGKRSAFAPTRYEAVDHLLLVTEGATR